MREAAQGHTQAVAHLLDKQPEKVREEKVRRRKCGGKVDIEWIGTIDSLTVSWIGLSW